MDPIVRFPKDQDSSKRHWAGAFGDFRISFLPGRPVSSITGETTISLSRGDGLSGTPVVVSGSGFAPGEQVTVRFHTEAIALARADSNGNFEVNARIPGTFDAFGTQQLDIIATGDSSVRHARASFQLRVSGGGVPGAGPATIGLSVDTGRSGTEVTVAGQNFAAGEEVRIRFHTEEIGSAFADSTGSFVLVVKIPSSYDMFAPQQFDVVATGQRSVETDRRPFNLTK